MSKTTKILNFSLGPVQSFIARARKTRDFWTGSFLISYLAGQAMAVILENRGGLILPAVAKDERNINDPLLQAIIDCRDGKEVISSNHNKAIVATLPNRFRAEVPADFDPVQCEQAIQNKWLEVATIIWDRYLSKVAPLGQATEDVWQRQTVNYWETNWVLSGDAAALDLRKNWRSHLPPIEHGDKCTLFSDLQELSGYLRIHEKDKQDAFWQAVREQKQAGIFYDLDETERLCSIALIKRLFPYVATDVIYDVSLNYPSTPYLAAVNWIVKTAANKSEEAELYGQAASALPEVQGRENPDLFPELSKIVATHPQARMFASLDGNCFFKNSLENPNLWDRPSSHFSETENLRNELARNLENLGAAPSPFYAMLLMDGDLVGALLQKHKDKTKAISNSLNRFSQQVPSCIEKGNGIVVYAGGDDILALLPLESALPTAIRLRLLYQTEFANVIPTLPTISGAIIYTHFNTPFTEVYDEAQSLLTNVAKDKTGRDSLAITIWKSAGKVLTWSVPWETVIDKFMPFCGNLQESLPDEKKVREFSNSFFYNIRSRLSLFTDGETDHSITSEVLEALLVAEYIKSRGSEADREKAKAAMKQLLELCRPHWKNREGKICIDNNRLELDCLFLTKFLIEKGVEQ